MHQTLRWVLCQLWVLGSQNVLDEQNSNGNKRAVKGKYSGNTKWFYVKYLKEYWPLNVEKKISWAPWSNIPKEWKGDPNVWAILTGKV